MIALKKYTIFTMLLLLMACVTINVYFPAAAAESAADTIIKEVYGNEGDASEAPLPGSDEQSGLQIKGFNMIAFVVTAVIPSAYAQQPDINISTPGINRLRTLMKNRHRSLVNYYNSGAIGMENNGLISVKDQKAVPLKERNTVKKLVADENRDRNALYSGLAKANGHPEWVGDIRKTFARRWIANAPAGWWYKGAGGNWQQK